VKANEITTGRLKDLVHYHFNPYAGELEALAQAELDRRKVKAPAKPATPIECLDQLRDSVSVLRDIANLPLGSGLEAQGILRARQAVEKLTGGKVRYSDDGGLQRVQKGE
jgi:hypothetical protein